MNNLQNLRKKHNDFIYHNYSITNNSFNFHFSMGEIHFYPSWSFNSKLINKKFDQSTLDYAVFNLGMMELVSYWKSACPSSIIIECGALDEYQVRWWKKLYLKGLGEFFYKNSIEAKEDFFNIIPKNTKPPELNYNYNTELKGAMIPVGGGKDSIVTMELLRNSLEFNQCYIINPRQPVVQTALTAGYSEENIIGVKRTIDKELLRLNSDGYLNGHTPFSGIVAFSGWIFSYVLGKKYLILSNESSANETNVTGTEINHQYSKSIEFESDFREYISKYFGNFPEYFSLLRPLSEWQIVKKFISYPEYFKVFQSCNVGSKTDTWCGKCAKCLYVYIMLSAFLTDEKLFNIFGLNMLDNMVFEDLFKGLINPSYDKPFECVGTREEIKHALYYSYKMRKNSLPVLLKKFPQENFSPDLDHYFDKNNFIPKEFLCLLN